MFLVCETVIVTASLSNGMGARTARHAIIDQICVPSTQFLEVLLLHQANKNRGFAKNMIPIETICLSP